MYKVLPLQRRDSKKLAVLDVRDSVSVPVTSLLSWAAATAAVRPSTNECLYVQDFAGGHIKGCMNITVDEFEDDDHVDNIIDMQLEGKEQVVVHCALSQQRGPFAARR